MRVFLVLELVWRFGPEDVRNVRAWNVLDDPTALPDTERHFKVFAAPGVHAFVVMSHRYDANTYYTRVLSACIK